MADPEPKTASLQSPALTLVSCVTLGRLLDFSVPSFPHLLEVNNKISFVLHSLCFNYHLHGVNHSVTLGYSYCFSIITKNDLFHDQMCPGFILPVHI